MNDTNSDAVVDDDVDDFNTLNLTVYPDDPPKSGEWVDTDDAIAEPTEEELAEGQRLGELIDVDDDEDSGADPDE
jgi:hypothetical protein